MDSLKLEQRQKVEKDQKIGCEIREAGEQRLEEANSYALAPIFGSLEDIEAIDIDDITILMECGKNILSKNLLHNLVFPLMLPNLC